MTKARAKNPFGKARKLEAPYAVYRAVYRAGTWEWRILKTYKLPLNETNDPYARWFCAVKSPHTFGGWDVGDTYRSDVLRHAALVVSESSSEWVAVHGS